MDKEQMDKEARKEVRRMVFVGVSIAAVGALILHLIIPVAKPHDYLLFVGLFPTLIGIALALGELANYSRWVKWDKRARPYREVKHLMYPYNPYPNVTCWNCGQLVRRPARSAMYVKPSWAEFNGRWKAFCSNCGANVTKEIVEAKYGNPYRGRVWPKFYKPASAFGSTRMCPNCGKENHKRLKNCEACRAPMATEAGEG